MYPDFSRVAICTWLLRPSHGCFPSNLPPLPSTLCAHKTQTNCIAVAVPESSQSQHPERDGSLHSVHINNCKQSFAAEVYLGCILTGCMSKLVQQPTLTWLLSVMLLSRSQISCTTGRQGFNISPMGSTLATGSRPGLIGIATLPACPPPRTHPLCITPSSLAALRAHSTLCRTRKVLTSGQVAVMYYQMTFGTECTQENARVSYAQMCTPPPGHQSATCAAEMTGKSQNAQPGHDS